MANASSEMIVTWSGSMVRQVNATRAAWHAGNAVDGRITRLTWFISKRRSRGELFVALQSCGLILILPLVFDALVMRVEQKGN
jgi:hypothetical protein